MTKQALAVSYLEAEVGRLQALLTRERNRCTAAEQARDTARAVARAYYYKSRNGAPAFPPDLEKYPWLKDG